MKMSERRRIATEKPAKSPKPVPAEEEADETDSPENDEILGLFGRCK